MTGVCIQFDENKGYGTILGDDTKKYMVHFSAIQSTDITLDEGERVTFEPFANKHVMYGKMATLVTRIVV